MAKVLNDTTSELENIFQRPSKLLEVFVEVKHFPAFKVSFSVRS